ncbi:TPA: hypothetical protein ACGEYF_004987 [Klebsiella variicola]|uniref:hypothetical protein n=1 Tax=Klebsiella variicola TaxID=244366 RepID=UPI002248156D|nr:hypothetical protein [Klebsiella variicola]MCW9234182.1 hypothetical protein [Klebsiella variicola]
MANSFKIQKTINANLTSDSGMNIGTQQVAVEIDYSVSLINITPDGTARAIIVSSVNDGDAVQADVFTFTYSMSSAEDIYDQALAQILASEKYAGAVAN